MLGRGNKVGLQQVAQSLKPSLLQHKTGPIEENLAATKYLANPDQRTRLHDELNHRQIDNTFRSISW